MKRAVMSTKASRRCVLALSFHNIIPYHIFFLAFIIGWPVYQFYIYIVNGELVKCHYERPVDVSVWPPVFTRVSNGLTKHFHGYLVDTFVTLLLTIIVLAPLQGFCSILLTFGHTFGEVVCDWGQMWGISRLLLEMNWQAQSLIVASAYLYTVNGYCHFKLMIDLWLPISWI